VKRRAPRRRWLASCSARTAGKRPEWVATAGRRPRVATGGAGCGLRRAPAWPATRDSRRMIPRSVSREEILLRAESRGLEWMIATRTMVCAAERALSASGSCGSSHPRFLPPSPGAAAASTSPLRNGPRRSPRAGPTRSAGAWRSAR
jgi:hypothetical protein